MTAVASTVAVPSPRRTIVAAVKVSSTEVVSAYFAGSA